MLHIAMQLQPAIGSYIVMQLSSQLQLHSYVTSQLYLHTQLAIQLHGEQHVNPVLPRGIITGNVRSPRYNRSGHIRLQPYNTVSAWTQRLHACICTELYVYLMLWISHNKVLVYYLWYVYNILYGCLSKQVKLILIIIIIVHVVKPFSMYDKIIMLGRHSIWHM